MIGKLGQLAAKLLHSGAIQAISGVFVAPFLRRQINKRLGRLSPRLWAAIDHEARQMLAEGKDGIALRDRWRAILEGLSGESWDDRAIGEVVRTFDITKFLDRFSRHGEMSALVTAIDARKILDDALGEYEAAEAAQAEDAEQ